jgi:ketosteroid isomerase-like protein
MTEPAGITKEQALEVVAGLLDALPGRGASALVEAMAPDVTWHADLHEGGLVEGAEAVASVLDAYVSAFGDLQAIPDTATAVFDSNILAIEFSVEGTNTGALPDGEVTNRQLSIRAAAFVTFSQDGRITELRTYWDRGLARDQLGLRAYARPGPV